MMNYRIKLYLSFFIILWGQLSMNEVEASNLRSIWKYFSEKVSRHTGNKLKGHDGRRIVGGENAEIKNHGYFVLILSYVRTGIFEVEEQSVYIAGVCGGTHIAAR